MELLLACLLIRASTAGLSEATPAFDAYAVGLHQGRMILSAMKGMAIAEMAAQEIGDHNADGVVNQDDYLAWFTANLQSATAATLTFGIPPGFENPLLPVPAGRFRMGATDDSARIPAAELPAHWVEVGDFALSRYEVTNAEYRQFVLAGGYVLQEHWDPEGWAWVHSHRTEEELKYWYGRDYGQDLQPVVGVSWYEADAYCRWAGGRLPTEAEWEKAARWDPGAGRSRLYPWGDEWAKELCNGMFDAISGVASVGSFPGGRSPYGLDDMAGNVWEWTADHFDPGLYAARASSTVRDPRVHIADAPRVLKGGAWYVTGIGPRGYYASYRHAQPPEYRGTDTGFRLAR